MENMLTSTRKAITAAGGVTALARALLVAPPSVSQWLSGTRGVPAGRVVQISEATGWRVTPHELRPDLYPHPDDGLPQELRGRQERAA
jgi:DNA-binding transcriptional regulator YdaS (Cro superfamily)